MTERRAELGKSRSRAWLLLGAAALGTGAAFVCLGEHAGGKPERAAPLSEVPAADLAPRAAKAAPPLLVATDGIPIMPHDPEERLAGPAHPHPITPAHARIYRENRLLGSMNGALDVRDGPGLRRLLGAYRAEYPEDTHALQQGYTIIADCLEHPGAAAEAAARRYYATAKASTLRRYVRRLCWETPR
jgi:hypothetical protein